MQPRTLHASDAQSNRRGHEHIGPHDSIRTSASLGILSGESPFSAIAGRRLGDDPLMYPYRPIAELAVRKPKLRRGEVRQ